MRYRKTVRIIYSVKNEEGFIVEQKRKFLTMQEAIMFLNALKGVRLIGNPILETK